MNVLENSRKSIIHRILNNQKATLFKLHSVGPYSELWYQNNRMEEVLQQTTYCHHIRSQMYQQCRLVTLLLLSLSPRNTFQATGLFFSTNGKNAVIWHHCLLAQAMKPVFFSTFTQTSLFTFFWAVSNVHSTHLQSQPHN